MKVDVLVAEIGSTMREKKKTAAKEKWFLQ